MKGRYIVVLKDDAPASLGSRIATLSYLNGVIARNQYTRALQGFSFEGSEATAARIAESPLVDYVEEVAKSQVTATQWGAPWSLDRIDQRILPLGGQYQYGYTGATTVVYVLDTGVNEVSELSGRILERYACVFQATCVTDPAYGVGDVREPPGEGHGTQVATIAAGSTYGVAKGAKIVSYRVGDSSGGIHSDAVVAALDDAIRRHQTSDAYAVANLSFAGDTFIQAQHDAITRALNAGISVVVSAGDGNSGTCSAFPASMPAVITVGGTTASDSKTSSSNHGSCIDIWAPADGVPAMNRAGGYVAFTGTSASAPLVAGVLALRIQQSVILGLPTDPASLTTMLKNYATTNQLSNIGTSPNLLLYSLVPPTKPHP